MKLTWNLNESWQFILQKQRLTHSLRILNQQQLFLLLLTSYYNPYLDLQPPHKLLAGLKLFLEPQGSRPVHITTRQQQNNKQIIELAS